MRQEPSKGDNNSKYPLWVTDTVNEKEVSPPSVYWMLRVCRTRGVLKEGLCKGCKLGYDQGNRDIAKAKCAMKVCCYKNNHLETCADCIDYSKCERTQTFHSHKGYKYKKYKESIEFYTKKRISGISPILGDMEWRLWKTGVIYRMSTGRTRRTIKNESPMSPSGNRRVGVVEKTSLR
jgi:hypothetical protein